MPRRRDSSGDSADPVLARHLPFDTDIGRLPRLGNVHSPQRPPNPPSYPELSDAHLIAQAGDADRWFTLEERSAAGWLRSRGLEVLSVQRRWGQRERTPDAVLLPAATTVELKHAVPTVNAIASRIRSGRGQSRRVLVDIRGPEADAAVAVVGLRSALRRYGMWLDEVVVVVSDDESIGWCRAGDIGLV